MRHKFIFVFVVALGIALMLAVGALYGKVGIRSLDGQPASRAIVYLILRDQLEKLVATGPADLGLCVSTQPSTAADDADFIELQAVARSVGKIRLIPTSECLGSDASGYRSPDGDHMQVLFARHVSGYWLGGLNCGGDCEVIISGYRVYTFLGYAVVLRGDPWIP